MFKNNDFFPQVMQRYTTYSPVSDVNREFIAALLHAFEEKPFCANDFDLFPIELIVEYVERTHVFYLQTKLPEIEQSIFLLSGLYSPYHPILHVLQNFFHSYCQDLTGHIRSEETGLLPYISLLNRCLKADRHSSEYLLRRGDYSIAQFLACHHDTEDELRDLQHTIRLYEPPPTNASLYRILLAQLKNFEQDLRVHAHIEDEVLITKALRMERIVNERLEKTAKSN